METLLTGALLGLSVAVPPGPNAAICVSRTLAAGRRAGLRCGLGVASAHAFHATLAVAGLIEPPGWSTGAPLPCTSEEASSSLRWG